MAYKNQTPREKHYRVVRYYPHFGHGQIAEVIGQDLSFDQARKLFDNNKPHFENEDVVIEDQTKVGFDAEVESARKEH